MFQFVKNCCRVFFFFFFFLPAGVKEMVGISLGKGCSGLKSHLVELVMRADMRLRLGRRRILSFFLFFPSVDRCG